MTTDTYDEFDYDPFFQGMMEDLRASAPPPPPLPRWLTVSELEAMEEANRAPGGLEAYRITRTKNGEWQSRYPSTLRQLDLFTMDWMDGSPASRQKVIGMEATGSFYDVWRDTHALPWSRSLFGAVHELKNYSRSKVYGIFRERLEERPTPTTPSAAELFLDYFPRVYKDNFGGYIGREDAMALLSYRLWASTKGIVGEAKVVKALHAWAATKGATYSEAPSHLEYSGIDGFLERTRPDGTRQRVAVSIKTEGALDPGFIARERETKPHRQAAEVYVGYKRGQDRLVWLTVQQVEDHQRNQVRKSA